MVDTPKPDAGAADAYDATRCDAMVRGEKGDTLSKIAKEIYGGPSLYSKIFEANTDPLKNRDLIQVGTMPPCCWTYDRRRSSSSSIAI